MSNLQHNHLFHSKTSLNVKSLIESKLPKKLSRHVCIVLSMITLARQSQTYRPVALTIAIT